MNNDPADTSKGANTQPGNEFPFGETLESPIVITALDGDTPYDLSHSRGAWLRGRTTCGKHVDFYSKFHCDWKITEFSFGNDGREKTGQVIYPASPKGDLSLELLRGFAAVNITFSPDALLPLAVHDPVELGVLLREGANPNRVPPMLQMPVSAIRGRLPLVLLDDLIFAQSLGITRIYEGLPEVEISPVGIMEQLSGIPSGRQPRFQPTHLHSSLEHSIGKLRQLLDSRHLLIEAGAFEVSDFVRAVRTHFFDKAAEFLAAGLPVDVLQSTGCTMLTECVVTKDSEALDWLLSNGANPNFRPHPSDSEIKGGFDVVEAVADLLHNPRLISPDPFPDCVFGDAPFRDHLNELFNGLSWYREPEDRRPQIHPSRFQPIVAALLSDNQPAFEKLLEHGADINAFAIFHRIIPPDWAFPRLAELGLDWLQRFGFKNRRCAVNLWQCRHHDPVYARGLELWRKYATPDEIQQAEESWAQLLDTVPKR
jgi:hypothetical protein